ncbi:hypothetical protein U1Q18_023535, partial [Sarracenia purpurea var. burkii]
MGEVRRRRGQGSQSHAITKVMKTEEEQSEHQDLPNRATRRAEESSLSTSVSLSISVSLKEGFVLSSLVSVVWCRKSEGGIPRRQAPPRRTSERTRLSIFSGNFSQGSRRFWGNTPENTTVLHFPVNCSAWEQTKTCPRNYPTTHKPSPLNLDHSSPKMCPEYFRWIHEDLRHWRETGITREMMEVNRGSATFRLVILNGRVYVEKYRNVYQTRDLFTLWGIVQLARRYPGRLPDLELMFNCDDSPVTRSNDYQGPNASPPPLFRYCSAAWSLDIVFPDWSFCGWAEINIKPWKQMLKDIQEGNNRVKWEKRVPLAYWRGNPYMGQTRQDLMKCDVANKYEWNTDLYKQDWDRETAQGFKQSNLEDQCTHRGSEETRGSDKRKDEETSGGEVGVATRRWRGAANRLALAQTAARFRVATQGVRGVTIEEAPA